MQKSYRTICGLLGLLVSCAMGCGSGGSEDMAPVEGKVTYQGKPLANAQVVFMPETANKLPASGMTDSDGHYELMTIVPGDGASIGKQRVTITARADTAANGALIEPGQLAPSAKPLIPRKYFMPDTSGLTAEVKPGGITANFDLKD